MLFSDVCRQGLESKCALQIGCAFGQPRHGIILSLFGFVNVPSCAHGILLAPEAAWNTAEELSIASGNPWKDRYGNMHGVHNEGFLRTVLREYCAQKGLPF